MVCVMGIIQLFPFSCSEEISSHKEDFFKRKLQENADKPEWVDQFTDCNHAMLSVFRCTALLDRATGNVL